MANTNLFGQLRTAITGIVKEFNALRTQVAAIKAAQVQMAADVAALRTKYEAHTHDGVTAGAAASGVRTAAMAAAALTYVAAAADGSNALENVPS